MTTTNRRRIMPGELDGVMGLDCLPIRVHADGTVTTDVRDAPYADVDADESVTGPWVLVSGYSGQSGYRGPVMHPSEYIGGGMARDILERPGLWVSVVVPAGCDEDCGDDCDGHDPDGWAVAHIPDDESE